MLAQRLPVQFCQDGVRHRLQPGQDLVVPESQDAKSLGLQQRGPLTVFAPTLLMLASINFDDKPSLHADEINNVAADWGLPAELVAG